MFLSGNMIKQKSLAIYNKYYHLYELSRPLITMPFIMNIPITYFLSFEHNTKCINSLYESIYFDMLSNLKDESASFLFQILFCNSP